MTIVDLSQGLTDLVAVALVAALAPIVVAVLPGPRIPQVVILLLGGVLIGPHVLGVAETSGIKLLANIGLGFLFLLAGYELDPRLLRQRPGKLAIVGWLMSAALAVGVAADRVGRGVASQVALALRISPNRAARYVGWATILTTELPHTFGALRAGRIGEWRAVLVARETIWLS